MVGAVWYASVTVLVTAAPCRKSHRAVRVATKRRKVSDVGVRGKLPDITAGLRRVPATVKPVFFFVSYIRDVRDEVDT